jgi:hypothetical protein
MLIGNHHWPEKLHFVKKSQNICTLLNTFTRKGKDPDP